MGQSYADSAENVRQFGVVVPFEVSYPKTFTGRFKSWIISACWPMRHVFAWLSISVCCFPSSVRTALTQKVLTTEETYHSWRIICLINVDFLLLVVGGAVPGAYGTGVITSTSADICLASLSVAPPPLYLTFFSAGLCPLAYLLL